jgi:hypothetical protein
MSNYKADTMRRAAAIDKETKPIPFTSDKLKKVSLGRNRIKSLETHHMNPVQFRKYQQSRSYHSDIFCLKNDVFNKDIMQPILSVTRTW